MITSANPFAYFFTAILCCITQPERQHYFRKKPKKRERHTGVGAETRTKQAPEPNHQRSK